MLTNISPLPPEAVITALAHALPDRAAVDSWAPMFGGRTNAAWHGTCCTGDIVVKLYAGPARNPMFPNDPAAEATLLQFLEPRRMAPSLRASFETPLGRCNVYDHLPGKTWQQDTPSVARLMRQLHLMDRPDGLREAADGSKALIAQIMSIVAVCGRVPDFLSDLPTDVVPPAGRQALLHSDIVPGNLIDTGSGLHLIDWQCPAVGDPCEDIAVFLSPAMQHVYRGQALSPQERDAFLVAYDDPAISARYNKLAPFYHARMAAYCLWQMENDRPEYGAGLKLEVDAFQRSLSP